MDRTMSMRMNMLRRTAVALLLACSVPIEAQQTAAGRAYDALIERLFAVQEDEDGIYILRFVRSAVEPEMQIVVSLPFEGGRCSAKVWHLPKDASPLAIQLLDRFDTLPPSRLYEGLVAIQTTVEFPCDGPLAKQLQEVPSVGVPIPKEYVIAIHGMSFQLEVRMGARRFELHTLAGRGLEGPYEEDPLLAWMATIGRAIRDTVR